MASSLERESCNQKKRRKTKTLPRGTTGILTMTVRAIETIKMAVAVGMATSI